jgi:uncharacterized membrane protein YgcG
MKNRFHLLAMLLVLGMAVGCDRKESEVDATDPEPTNTAPAITDPGALSVVEGSTDLGSLTTTDADGDTVTLTLGGADAAAFDLTDGSLSFAVGPDFEVPGDADGNNVYVLDLSGSDGTDTTTLTIEISVLDAFEGRVIDGPVSGADVFVDLNCNALKDEGEPTGITDENGFFKAGKVAPAADCKPKIISRGGTDTTTGKVLPDLVLVADLPADETKAVALTPLSTVLSSAETEAEKQQVLDTLGLSGTTPEQILTTDSWAGAEANTEADIAIQRVNQQVATILATAVAVADDGDAATENAASNTTAAALSLISQVKAVNESNTNASVPVKLDLADPAVVISAVTATVASAGRDEVAAEVLSAIGKVVSDVNTAAADVTVNPTSTTAIAIATSAQNAIATDVVAVVIGTTSVEQFEEATTPSVIFENVVVVDAPDFDNDGLADALDPDDDNDGLSDTLDPFPFDRTETADTDLDGIGNNKDGDDDGDGLLDTLDAFPLIAIGTLTDSDGDGRPNDCDVTCQATGMSADNDDDNDGILDAGDAFSLIAIGALTDTDGDGAPDSCAASCVSLGMSADTDDDGDGILDTADAFSLVAIGALTDTDGDGAPDSCAASCVSLGMSADTDDDNDGVLDERDAFALISLGGRLDTDGDGYPNDCDAACLATSMTGDLDDDNDGIVDSNDAFPLIAIGALLDTDKNGAPNECDTACLASGMTADLDDDGDGVSDSLDSAPLDSSVSEASGGTGDADESGGGSDSSGGTGSGDSSGAGGVVDSGANGGFKLPSTITVLKTEE